MNGKKLAGLRIVSDSVLTLIMAVLFLVYPFRSEVVIMLIAAAVLLVGGLIDLGLYVSENTFAYFARGLGFEGVAKLLLGLYIFSHTSLAPTSLCHLVSIYVILLGVSSLDVSTLLRTLQIHTWPAAMVLGAMIIFAGAVMLLYPTGAIAPAMILSGILMLLQSIFQRKRQIISGLT